MRIIKIAGLLCIALLPFGVTRADVTLNLRDADLSTLIFAVSEITGKNFIVDPKVKGKVTVVSSSPMNERAVYETFLAVLEVQGFAAVPAGHAIKIIPEANARSDAGIRSADGTALPLDDVVTHVYELHNVSATQLVPLLRPLVPNWGHLVAYPGNNMLIVSDRAGNVARIEGLLRQLDQAGDREIESVVLQYASATDVAKLASDLLQRGKNGDAAAPQTAVVSDERSNKVFISGEKAERIRVLALVKSLDTPTPDGDATQVVFLRYASAESLAPILQGYGQQIGGGTKTVSAAAPSAAMPGGSDAVKILSDRDTNSLVITAPAKVMQLIRRVIEQLDIQRPQVLVEAIVAEVSSTRSSELGLNFAAYRPNGGAVASILDSSVLSAIGAAATGGGLSALSALGTGISVGGASIRNDGRSGTSFGVLLKALQSDGDTNVLSTPSLVSMDNQESEVSVGQEVPFQTGSYANTGSVNGNGAVNPFQTIERKDVGLKLAVTPQINEGDTVKLKIRLESSSVAGGTPGGPNLVTNKRTISNTVNVDSGQVLVLGGLTDDNLNESQSGVPGLSGLPLLGNLFKSRSLSKTKRNLMVFIHPVILRNATDGLAQTKQRYERMRAAQKVSATKQTLGPNQDRPVLLRLDDFLHPQEP